MYIYFGGRRVDRQWQAELGHRVYESETRCVHACVTSYHLVRVVSLGIEIKTRAAS